MTSGVGRRGGGGPGDDDRLQTAATMMMSCWALATVMKSSGDGDDERWRMGVLGNFFFTNFIFACRRHNHPHKIAISAYTFGWTAGSTAWINGLLPHEKYFFYK
jgi:anaerobic selenocysteine-containing dehydrogenase